jgi:hypothetical protein
LPLATGRARFSSAAASSSAIHPLSSASASASASPSSPSLSPAESLLAASLQRIEQQLDKAVSKIDAVEVEIRQTSESLLSPSIDADERAFLGCRQTHLLYKKKHYLDEQKHFLDKKMHFLLQEKQMQEKKVSWMARSRNSFRQIRCPAL